MKILPSVRLSTNQKRVIAKIVASPTPKVAGGEITNDQNLVGATNDLERLGCIEVISGEAALTSKGEEIARAENIINDSGQLTPDGEALAYTDPKGKPDKDQPKNAQQTPPPGLPAGPAGAPMAPMAPPGGGAPGGAPPAGDMAGLTMSYVPQYGSMDLLRELLDEGRKVRRPGWGVARRRVEQFSKKQETSPMMQNPSKVDDSTLVYPETFGVYLKKSKS